MQPAIIVVVVPFHCVPFDSISFRFSSVIVIVIVACQKCSECFPNCILMFQSVNWVGGGGDGGRGEEASL